MTQEIKTQKAKVGVAGSFINQLMSNNSSMPVVGEGATLMYYSDRSCYEVVEVSENGKTVRMEALDAEWDKTKPGGQGHQNWILKPSGRFVTAVWRNNCWKMKITKITFSKEFRENHKDAVSFERLLTEEQREAIYGGSAFPKNIVKGFTEKKISYYKIKIFFGAKDYWYDWSF